MITPFCKFPYEVVEAWVAKLLTEVTDFDRYLEENGSISIEQTSSKGENKTDIFIWKWEGEYALMYFQTFPESD